MHKLLLISACLFLFGNSHAQNYLSTERLNINNNADVMPKGRWQVEAGLQYEVTSIEYYNVYLLQSPIISQRYGISDRVELRLSTSILSNFVINKGAITTNYQLNGATAPDIGTKINILKQKKFIPQISVLAEANFSPLASQIYRSTRVSPSIRLLMSHTIQDKLTLGYNFGTNWNTVFSYSYDFYVQKKWGKDVLTNLEYSGSWTKPNEMFDNTQQNIYGSLGYYIDPNVLCDVGLGTGINNSPDYFFRFGFSFGLRK